MAAYDFLWRGTDPDGKPHKYKVRAESAQAARAQLTDAGWTNLELISDEISAVAGSGVQSEDWMKEDLTADQEADFFEGKGPGFFKQWFMGFKDSWIML